MPDPVTLNLTLTQAVRGNSAGDADLGPATVNVFSVLGFTSRLGLRFQFPGLQFDSGGLVLDPPIFATATLRLFNSVTNPTAVPLKFFQVLDDQPAPFALATDLYPSTTQLLSVLTNSAGGTPASQSFGPLAAGSFVDFPFRTDLVMACTNKVRTGITWNGYLDLIVTVDETADYSLFLYANTVGFTPILTVTYVPFHTGHWSDRPEVGRAVHSMRSGIPALSGDLTEDGYSDGIWVTAQEWDPDDPFEFDEYVPSGDEGSRQDEVPT